MTAAMARAVRFDRYGGREVLYLADVEMPSPDPGEVVVEVRAGINPGEAAIRTGAPMPTKNSRSLTPAAKSFYCRTVHIEEAGMATAMSMTLMSTNMTAKTR
jgi:hypothetical protein